MSKSDESRQRICEAAIAIASRDGFAAMSLDAVATQAGVSKGGLLYHFRTREELIHGTLQHFSETGRQMLLDRIAADPVAHMRWARGIVSCLFPTDEELAASTRDLDPEISFRFMLAMLSVAADRKTDVAPITKFGNELRDLLLEDESTAVEQVLVWLAIDGLMVWRLLGLIDPSDDLFTSVGDALRSRVGLDVSNRSEGDG
ncbi:MAG: TetR/AcrR family transcriptional regulator [Aureliella sp.]